MSTNAIQSTTTAVLETLSVAAEEAPEPEPSKPKRKATKKRKALFTKKKPPIVRAKSSAVPDTIDDHVQPENEVGDPTHVAQQEEKNNTEEKQEDELSFDKSPVVAKTAKRVKRKLLIELDEKVVPGKKVVEDDFVFRRRRLAASTPDPEKEPIVETLEQQSKDAPQDAPVEQTKGKTKPKPRIPQTKRKIISEVIEDAPAVSENEHRPPEKTTKRSRKEKAAQPAIMEQTTQEPVESQTLAYEDVPTMEIRNAASSPFTKKSARRGKKVVQDAAEEMATTNPIMDEDPLPVGKPPRKIRRAAKSITDEMQPGVDEDAASVPTTKTVKKSRKAVTTAAEMETEPAPRKRVKKAVVEASRPTDPESQPEIEASQPLEEVSVPAKKPIAKPRRGKKIIEHVEKKVMVEDISALAGPAEETTVKPRRVRAKISNYIATETPVIEQPENPAPKTGRRKAAASIITGPSLDENTTPAPVTTKRKRQPLSEQEANTSSPQKLPLAGNDGVQEETTKSKRAKTAKTTTKPRMTKRVNVPLEDELNSKHLAIESAEQVHTSTTEHANPLECKSPFQPRKGRSKKPIEVFSGDKLTTTNDAEPVSAVVETPPEPVPPKRLTASKTIAQKPASQKSQDTDVDADLFAPMTTTTSLSGGPRKQARKPAVKPKRMFAARDEDVDLSDVFDGIAALAAGGSA